MGGAALAYDIISGNVIFDENTLIQFIEHGFEWENDYHWLTTAQQLGFLDDLIQALLPYVYEILGYWGSIWDFIPSDYLDEALEMLDPVESAPLIAQTKRFNSEIADKYGVNLQKAKDAGANITIISGYGIPSVTGLQEHSDAIIRAKDTSGALCAPFGQRFADGYKTANTACSDPTHNHLSPSMELDASTCWLPENTWFVNELYHGMQRHDPYSASLMYMQLLSKNPLKSVHESAAYPQFRDSSNPCNPITIKFNHSKPGYLSSEDSSIIISNNLTDSSVDVYGIRAQGVNITFEDFDVKTIKKGRSIEIKFTGDIPEESLTRCAITVTYVANKTLTPIGSKQFSFTIMNGAPVEYDESNPFTDADFPIITFDANDRIKNSPFAALIDAIRTLLIKFFKVFVDIMKIIARMN